MSQPSNHESQDASDSSINWTNLGGSNVGFAHLYLRLLSLRGPVGIVAVVSGLAVGAVLEWPAAFAVAMLGLVLCLDAALRSRGVFTSITGTVLVDTTLIAATIWLLRAPPAVISMPFAYIIATSFLVLAPRKAIVPVAYAVMWMSVLLIGNRFWWAQSEGTAGLIVSVTMGSMFVGSLLVMFGSAGKILADVKHSLDRKVRFEEAIAASSRAFATSDDDDPIELALEALLKATEATAVFVERNVQHPDLGLCSTLIAEVLADGVDADPEDTWTMVPWDEMPVSFASLSAAKAVAFKVADLPEIERARYDGSGVLSELDIPILVRGEWVGLVGFSDVITDRTWDAREIELLSTAAELIGAHWERVEGREQLEQAVARLERRHRLEQALAQASSALLASEDSAVDEALEALLVATEADVVFLDENYEDPNLGLATNATHWVSKEHDSSERGQEEWWGGPYSELPTSHDQLAIGRPSVILTSQLSGPERELYEADGLLSELCLPVFVKGQWRGSVGFADYQIERQWTEQDIRFLRTAADLVGSYWEREDAVALLDTRLNYEQALARVSQELLSDGPDALATALGHIFDVADPEYMWMDEQVIGRDGLQSTRLVHKLESPDLQASGFDIGNESRVPTDTPTRSAKLSRGEPAVIQTIELEGDEQAAYERSAIKSELVLPFYVYGQGAGTVGFVHCLKQRSWSDNDVSVLRTAAGLIGSYVERRRTHERLEELIRAKDDFIASISHEIRTPLTAVMGFASVLREGYEQLELADIDEMLQLVSGEAQEVSWIVEDLLVYGRSDIGTLEATSVDLCLEEQVRAVLSSQTSGVLVNVSMLSGGDRVMGDPIRVRQIVRNLLTNAAKYGGPNIEVRTALDGASVLLSVIDDGDGIALDERELVFDAYFKAHQAVGKPGSIGLGLHVSRKLAELMGGDVRYDRVDDKSHFTLVLPASKAAVMSA